MNTPLTIANKQHGAVLIMGLVLLMALTIVGVAMMSNNTLEQRMAGNAFDSNLAFNAAETASRSVERLIFPLTIPPSTSSSCASTKASDGLCIISLESFSSVVGTVPEWWKDKDHPWWLANATEYDLTDNLSDKIRTNPRIIVEQAGYYRDSLRVGDSKITGTNFYNITTRGTGASDNSQAVVQWAIAKRTN
jgi:type IV pilus assembly protein PilX